MHEYQPYYAARLCCYKHTRGGLFGDAISFVEEHHESVNNRKTESGGAGPECGGSGWTLLHQAAYWQLLRAMLERLAAAGANGLVADWNGLTPLDGTAQGEQEGLQSRIEWRHMTIIRRNCTVKYFRCRWSHNRPWRLRTQRNQRRET